MAKKEGKIIGFFPRFREWQKERLHYENKSTGLSVCANCDLVRLGLLAFGNCK